MLIEKMNRADLEVEILMDDELYNKIQSEQGNAESYLTNLKDDELRNLLSNWIINNDDCAEIKVITESEKI